MTPLPWVSYSLGYLIKIFSLHLVFLMNFNGSLRKKSLSVWVFFVCLFIFVLEIESLYEVLAVLEFTMQSRLAGNSQRSVCICVINAGITIMLHHTQLYQVYTKVFKVKRNLIILSRDCIAVHLLSEDILDLVLKISRIFLGKTIRPSNLFQRHSVRELCSQVHSCFFNYLFYFL